jgi:hypothetical protein
MVLRHKTQNQKGTGILILILFLLEKNKKARQWYKG